MIQRLGEFDVSIKKRRGNGHEAVASLLKEQRSKRLLADFPDFVEFPDSLR